MREYLQKLKKDPTWKLEHNNFFKFKTSSAYILDKDYWINKSLEKIENLLKDN